MQLLVKYATANVLHMMTPNDDTNSLNKTQFIFGRGSSFQS